MGEQVLPGAEADPEATDTTFSHPVQIEVGGSRFDTKVAFADVLGLKGAPGLAGQVGFFNLFVVKFDYQKEVLEIKEKS